MMLRGLYNRVLSALGLKTAAVEAVPASTSVALPAPAVPKRSYSLPTRNWASAFARPVEWAPRTKPVRNRAYRRMRAKLRVNVQADYRRVNGLVDRDEAVWRVRNGSSFLSKTDDRNQKPLNRAEWRWLEQQAEKLTPTGSLAKLLLEWNGR